MAELLARWRLGGDKEERLQRLLGSDTADLVQRAVDAYRLGDQVLADSLEEFRGPAERALKAAREFAAALADLRRLIWRQPGAFDDALQAARRIEEELDPRLRRPPNRDVAAARYLLAAEVARILGRAGYRISKSGRPRKGSVARTRLEQGLPVDTSRAGWVLAETLGLALRVEDPAGYVRFAVDEYRKPAQHEGGDSAELSPLTKAFLDRKKPSR